MINSDNRPIAQLLGDLIESVNKLIHQELELVRVETAEKAREALMGVIGILGGMLVALAALLVLVQALVVALANYMPPEIAAGIAEHATDDALSQREIEVLRQVADGNGNKRIAQLLGISEETVKAHMKNILSKLDANDRTHAVTIAVRRGIFDL